MCAGFAGMAVFPTEPPYLFGLIGLEAKLGRQGFLENRMSK